MPRVIYRVSRIHSCFSQELGEPKPESCRCRKFCSRAEADEKVKLGEAEWLLDFAGSEPTPTWDICLTGRRTKVPRGALLDKAHIQRGTEASDGGSFARELVDNFEEISERFDDYASLELEARILLFSVGRELLLLKQESDRLGTISGPEAKFLVRDLVQKADKCKFDSFVPGPEGPVLSMIGLDERTHK